MHLVTLQRALLIGWVLVFLAMSAILYGYIAGINDLLPQTRIWGYTNQQMWDFRQALFANGAQTYRLVIVYLDSIFITLFVFWVSLAHHGRFSIWVTAVLVFGFGLADFFENGALVADLCLDEACTLFFDPTQNEEQFHLVPVTQVKFAFFVACLLSVVYIWVSERKRS